jgi:monoamine oxidase
MLVQSFFGLFYTGDASRFSVDTIPKRYQQERSMVEMGYGSLCPAFQIPTCARDESFAVYEGPVGHSWPNDPYVKGSYSYTASGQEALLTSVHEEAGEMVKTLFAPIDQALYFAGKHASILMDVPGTMETACESGECVARMIGKAKK